MLRRGQRIGKYRIESTLGEGGFARVYSAYDTIEGIRVALKVPFREFVTPAALKAFTREVRIAATLDHPNILPLKNAGFVEDRFVIATPLGRETLRERLKRRMTLKTRLSYAEQLMEAVAYAHNKGIIHCDIKPENLILFDDGRLRLCDFGVAKVSLRTVTLLGSASGTVGYMAPEQAMGRTSFQSDVFSIGLVVYELFTLKLLEWPFEWPGEGHERLQRSVHPDFIKLLRKSLEVSKQRRFQDAVRMLAAYRRLKPRVIRGTGRRTRKASRAKSDWRTLRFREFKRLFGRELRLRYSCHRCGGPTAETMTHCPWCGHRITVYRGPVSFPRRCRRCGRGVKSDWRFCAWCYGPAINRESISRRFSDKRYGGHCANPSCQGKLLMPLMRYCPWCRTKVRRNWKAPTDSGRCEGCSWGVKREYWSFCPWCGRALE